MREKLQRMSHLAEMHMAAAQQHQKAWYDKSAWLRRFEPDQKVLVMLPTSDSKLLAKWRGPFEVQEQTEGRIHSSRVLHGNRLKEWFLSLFRQKSEPERF